MNTLSMIFGLSSLLAIGCAAESSSQSSLQLDFAGLEPLGGEFVYEGWLIGADGPVSTGRFSLQGASAPALVIDSDLLLDASSFVLTIEPGAGDDPAPSETHVLAGTITGTSTELTVASAAALGSDFTSATGSFVLATPSSASMSDNNQGIWWLALPDKTPSLELPSLPAGWVYEGWIASNDGPISTGRFTSFDMSDSDGAGASSGPDAAPEFPGQDFIDPALDLVGLTAVISVEPDPDDSPAPFALKPLLATIAPELAPSSQVMMNNAEASAPSGVLTIVEK